MGHQIGGSSSGHRSSSEHWSLLSGHGSPSGHDSLSGQVTEWTWVIGWYNVLIFQIQSYK